MTVTCILKSTRFTQPYVLRLIILTHTHTHTRTTLFAKPCTAYATIKCRIVTIRHTLSRTEWVQSCYKRSQHVTCYQPARNSFAGFTGKFQYLQILLLLPVGLLRNSVTCKVHGIHYPQPQFTLLANSTTVTFTANFHYLQCRINPSRSPMPTRNGGPF